MKECHLKVEKTARYYLLGEPGEHIREVWFVCHGYGQLAAHFIEHFDVLKSRSRLFVAPEGLSKFYLNGFSGRIGATWMTKEDRLHEIEDYVSYLDAVYADIKKSLHAAPAKIVLLGFSQGTAAVCRWIGKGGIRADHLVIWAGGIPPEFYSDAAMQPFRDLTLSFVIGSEDEIANSEAVAEQKAVLEKFNVPFNVFTFAGGHQMNPDMLCKIAKLT